MVTVNTRECPKCTKLISYSTKFSCINAEKKSSLCKTCSQQGRVLSESHKNNLSKSHTSKKLSFTEEHKRNISKGKIGVKFSNEHKQNIAKANTGKTMLSQTKEAIIKSRKGKNLTTEHKNKIRLSNIKSFELNDRVIQNKCKFFTIAGLLCQGTYEKYYIEKLIENGETIPTKPKRVSTPYGTYKADFEFSDRLVDIKSEYTYRMLVGEIPDYNGLVSLTQLNKIMWVNNNIKPVEIKVIKK